MNARILIADDVPQVRSVLKWVLESHSREWKICAEADNGVQAIEKAVESKPELIILDFQMPGMDGLSASTRISKLLPDIPILIFTLHKSDHLDREAKRAGVREVVSKSNVAEMVSAVERLLGENPGSKVVASESKPA